MKSDIFWVFFSIIFISVVDEKKFVEAAGKGNLVPLYRCIFSDQLTPVLAYRCLVQEDDREAPSFLFESVEPGSGSSSVVRALTVPLIYIFFSYAGVLCGFKILMFFYFLLY